MTDIHEATKDTADDLPSEGIKRDFEQLKLYTLRFWYNFSYTYMVAYPIKMSGQMSGHSFRSYQSYLYEKHLP